MMTSTLAPVGATTLLHPNNSIRILNKKGELLYRAGTTMEYVSPTITQQERQYAEQLHEIAWRVADFVWDRFHECGIDGKGFIPKFVIGSADGSTSYSLSCLGRSSAEFNFANGDILNEVVAHEYMHGIVSWLNPLEYQGESGALNESLADVFGIVFKQSLGATDWRLKNYRDISQPPRLFQRDEEPNQQNDFGHVHDNSCILSHGFYRIAMRTKDYDPGFKTLLKIWWVALKDLRNEEKNFKGFVNKTIEVAEKVANKRYQEEVNKGWEDAHTLKML